MKKVKLWMLAVTIIYVLWVIGFSIYNTGLTHYQEKLILFGASIPYTIIMWRLWKKMIAAYIKEQQDKNVKKMMNGVE